MRYPAKLQIKHNVSLKRPLYSYSNAAAYAAVIDKLWLMKQAMSY